MKFSLDLSVALAKAARAVRDRAASYYGPRDHETAPMAGQVDDYLADIEDELGAFLVDTADADRLVELLRIKLAFMTPEARLDLFRAVMEGYCRHCGRPEEHATGERCQCWNDE